MKYNANWFLVRKMSIVSHMHLHFIILERIVSVFIPILMTYCYCFANLVYYEVIWMIIEYQRSALFMTKCFLNWIELMWCAKSGEKRTCLARLLYLPHFKLLLFKSVYYIFPTYLKILFIILFHRKQDVGMHVWAVSIYSFDIYILLVYALWLCIRIKFVPIFIKT